MADKTKNLDSKSDMDTNPVIKAQADKYVDNQKSAQLFKDIAQYMFWGATTLLAVGFGLGATVSASMLPFVFGGSALTFLGSMFFNNKGTEIAERGTVQYSDIDSKNQAHRMVQAFAVAQTQGKLAGDPNVPFSDTTATKSWGERVGGARSQQPSSGWAERIAAQAQAEEQQALAGLKAR